MAQDGIQSAAGDAQVMQFLRIVSQSGAGLVQMPGGQVAAKVRQGNLDHGHGGIYRRRREFRRGPGANPTDLSPSEYFVSDAASSAQSLRRVFTSDCRGSWASVRASTSTRCMLAWGSPCGREMTVSSRAISPSCRASSFSADRESLPRGAQFEQRQQSCAPLTAHTRVPTGPIESSDRFAVGTLERFAQLPAVCDLRAGGMQRLERRFGLFRTPSGCEARSPHDGFASHPCPSRYRRSAAWSAVRGRAHRSCRGRSTSGEPS